MKRTLTINLGGIVFHIDEDAYEMLYSYLDKLKKHFREDYSDEIMDDIEGRLAEMFNQQKIFDHYVITISDVEKVTQVMGDPDEIAGEATNQSTSETSSSKSNYKSNNKRFFRNPDDKILGGVCSGVSAYFNIDPIWLRLVFALTIIFAGTGIMIYVILWIIIPEATTPLEKMQMRGKELNISNIERSIKNEAKGIKDRMESLSKDFASAENKHRIRYTIQNIFNGLGQVILGTVKFLGLALGATICFIALAVLVSLSIMLFVALGWLPSSDTSLLGNRFLSKIVTDRQLLITSIGVLVIVALPVVVLLLNGIKILFKVSLNLKKIGAVLSALWVIGIFIVLYETINIGKDFRQKAVVSVKEVIPIHYTNNLSIKLTQHMKMNEQVFEGNEFIISNGNTSLLFFPESGDSVMCSDIRLDISSSLNDSVYLVTTYSSRGRTIEEAKKLASQCGYLYSIVDSAIYLNDVFNLSRAKKYRAQHLNLNLQVPIGTVLNFDPSLKGFLHSIEGFTGGIESEMLNHRWQMNKNGLERIDYIEKKQSKMDVPPTKYGI